MGFSFSSHLESLINVFSVLVVSWQLYLVIFLSAWDINFLGISVTEEMMESANPTTG
ncbi:MAG: hypothetical protein JST95_02365 [Bacteroidetes bacterium]|nr:hypothetical protein [Bacteroidota bacterium]